MAIAFVSATNGGEVSSTSLTYAHDATGEDFLIVGVQTNADTVTGVTYAGVSMTAVAGSKVSTGGSAFQQLWVLPAPTTGSNNVVISRSNSGEIRSVCSGYSGVNQSTTVDNSTSVVSSGTTTSLDITLTPTVVDCWMVACGGYQRDPTAGTNTTQRAESGGAFGIYDNNAAINPTAATTLQITYSSVGDGGMAMGAITIAVPQAVVGVASTSGRDFMLTGAN